jgi:hypothetical protein
VPDFDDCFMLCAADLWNFYLDAPPIRGESENPFPKSILFPNNFINAGDFVT